MFGCDLDLHEFGVTRYLETIDGEKATENAFFEASSEHYDVVFFIHCALAFRSERERESLVEWNLCVCVCVCERDWDYWEEENGGNQSEATVMLGVKRRKGSPASEVALEFRLKPLRAARGNC